MLDILYKEAKVVDREAAIKVACNYVSLRIGSLEATRQLEKIVKKKVKKTK